MELIPPRLFGPLSECSRAVLFENALPGATVVLVRTRGAVSDRVGTTTATNSSGSVALDPAEIFIGGDRVVAYQHTSTGASPWGTDALEVQHSEGTFNPPQVLTHLYACSRGFSVGAMRPGTRVEVLNAGVVIATGIAIDGTAHLRVNTASGLPSTGTILTIRQRICPKPPPPGGAPEWVVDSQLPPVEPFPPPAVFGGQLPAPIITAGHTACSRSVTVERVIPGAEVILEDTGRGWWASRGPSDATTMSIAVPVSLKEGDRLEVRQEAGCRMTSERRVERVGPQAQLPKLSLFQIDCASSATVYVRELKAEANVEFEVVHAGETKVYRSVATRTTGPFPAPPMPVGATVRVRHGECETWSDWSDPQMANALLSPIEKPRIVGELFQCQNAIPVANIFPLSGVLVVTSSITGELARTSEFGNVTTIRVAPSLVKDHHITVEHHVCGQRAGDRKQVQPLAPPGVGEVEPPLYDGDTTVTIRDVTAGAYLELWDQTQRLETGYAPFSTSGKVKVTFSMARPLVNGQHIHAKFWHCGRYGRNEGRPVHFRKPELESVHPSEIFVPSSDPTAFQAQGRYFRSGALMSFTGAGFVNTRFESTTNVTGLVAGNHVASPRTVKVLVQNPDGQMTGTVDVELRARPAPAPPTPPPTAAAGYSQVALYNCNTDHRDVHIWKRDLTTGGPYVFVTTLNHQYDGDWGTCPASGSEPFEIALVDGHDTAIVVVDPENIGCIPPGGDPNMANPPATPDTLNIACQRSTAPLVVHGKSGGATLPYIIP